MQQGGNHIRERNGNDVLQLYHPQEAFALNLRYLSSVVPALCCHVDKTIS